MSPRTPRRAGRGCGRDTTSRACQPVGPPGAPPVGEGREVAVGVRCSPQVTGRGDDGRTLPHVVVGEGRPPLSDPDVALVTGVVHPEPHVRPPRPVPPPPEPLLPLPPGPYPHLLSPYYFCRPPGGPYPHLLSPCYLPWPVPPPERGRVESDRDP